MTCGYAPTTRRRALVTRGRVDTLHHFGGILVTPGYTDPVKLADGHPYGVSHATGADNDAPLGDPQEDALRHLRRHGGTADGYAARMTHHKASVDTVVLDIDGTLVDTNYHHTVAWVRAFRSLGLDVQGWRVHRAIGMGGDRLVGHVAGQAVEDRSGDAVREAWEKAYDEMLEEPVAFAGAAELLTELRDRELRVVLASSAIPRHAERSLELLGESRGHADATTTSEDAEESKPDPELLALAIDRVHGSSSVVVGDSVWDAEAAGRLGIPAVAVRSGGFGEAELREAGAGWVFTDVEELRQHLDEVVAPRR